MSKPTKLDNTQIASALETLSDWKQNGDQIEREFQFADFNEAWGFMNRVALIAEQMNHHPDWSNVYRTVNIALTTHDAGGLSDLDMEMARRIDGVVANS